MMQNWFVFTHRTTDVEPVEAMVCLAESRLALSPEKNSSQQIILQR